MSLLFYDQKEVDKPATLSQILTLLLGIIVLPFIFYWFSFKKKYPKWIKYFGGVWLVLFVSWYVRHKMSA